MLFFSDSQLWGMGDQTENLKTLQLVFTMMQTSTRINCTLGTRKKKPDLWSSHTSTNWPSEIFQLHEPIKPLYCLTKLVCSDFVLVITILVCPGESESTAQRPSITINRVSLHLQKYSGLNNHLYENPNHNWCGVRGGYQTFRRGQNTHSDNWKQ